MPPWTAYANTHKKTVFRQRLAHCAGAKHELSPEHLQAFGWKPGKRPLCFLIGDDVGDKFFLKCLGPEQEDGNDEYEINRFAYGLAEKLGVRVPEPVRCWENSLLFRYVTGDPVGDRYTWDDEELVLSMTEDIFAFIEKLQDVTSVPDVVQAKKGINVDARRNFLALIRPRIDARTYALMRAGIELYDANSYSDSELVLSHCDINTAHILRTSERRIALTDWELLSLAHPSTDYACYLSTCATHPRGRSEARRLLRDDNSIAIFTDYLIFGLHYLGSKYAPAVASRYESAVRDVLGPPLP